MPYSLFQGGRRRRRPRWRGRLVAVLLAMLTGFLAVVLLAGHDDDGSRTARAPRAMPTVGTRLPLQDSGPAPLAGGGTAPSPPAVRLRGPPGPGPPPLQAPPPPGPVFR